MQHELDVSLSVQTNGFVKIHRLQCNQLLLSALAHAMNLSALDPVVTSHISSPVLQDNDCGRPLCELQRCWWLHKIGRLQSQSLLAWGCRRWSLRSVRRSVIPAGRGPRGHGNGGSDAGRWQRNLYVFEESQGEPGFALERGIRSAGGEREDLDRPKHRNRPEKGIPLRVAATVDFPFGVDFQVGRGND